MIERKADQEKMEAERKAHQEDLQKIMKEIIDANQMKTDDNQEEMDVDLKEMREEITFCQAEMKSTLNAFREKIDAAVANRKDNRKETTFC
jgi:Skp family chaperone for outer membrane proteins